MKGGREYATALDRNPLWVHDLLEHVPLHYFSARVLAAVSCESLSALVLPDTMITIVQSMAAGGFHSRVS